MKTASIKILLEPELAEFARTDARAAAFSVSEYMQGLIRRRREERIAEDVALLGKAIAGAPLGDPSGAQMWRIYAAIKKGRK